MILIVKFILKSFDLKIKINQISYISENKVNVTLDFTSRNLDKVLDIGGKDDILYERSFKRLGYKFVDEFEKVIHKVLAHHAQTIAQQAALLLASIGGYNLAPTL